MRIAALIPVLLVLGGGGHAKLFGNDKREWTSTTVREFSNNKLPTKIGLLRRAAPSSRLRVSRSRPLTTSPTSRRRLASMPTPPLFGLPLLLWPLVPPQPVPLEPSARR